MDSPRPAIRGLSDVGRVGRLELVFGLKSGRTVIRHAYSEIPHKITRLYHPDNSSLAQLILMNSTAGLFPGDRVDIQIRVERGARVLISSQASTKVHPGLGIAEQSLHAAVEPEAELHIYNDPLIPFRAARLRQRTTLEIASDSRLCFWDGFMAGRVERGEIWAFEEIDAETRVVRDGNLIYLERYRLHPALEAPERPFVMGTAAYVATGLFTEAPPPLPATNIGIDQPAQGLHVVRALARTGSEYREIQRQILNAIFEQRGEPVPDLRKV